MRLSIAVYFAPMEQATITHHETKGEASSIGIQGRTMASATLHISAQPPRGIQTKAAGQTHEARSFQCLMQASSGTEPSRVDITPGKQVTTVLAPKDWLCWRTALHFSHVSSALLHRKMVVVFCLRRHICSIMKPCFGNRGNDLHQQSGCAF